MTRRFGIAAWSDPTLERRSYSDEFFPTRFLANYERLSPRGCHSIGCHEGWLEQTIPTTGLSAENWLLILCARNITCSPLITG